MTELMSVFSNTKATINKLELLAEMYYEGNINVVNGDFNNHIEIEQNLIKVGDLQGVVSNIQIIDYDISTNKYDKEIRVFLYKEMIDLKRKFLWAFLSLKGIAKVGITFEEFDELTEKYRKKFEFDVYENMIKEEFEKEDIKIKW